MIRKDCSCDKYYGISQVIKVVLEETQEVLCILFHSYANMKKLSLHNFIGKQEKHLQVFTKLSNITWVGVFKEWMRGQRKTRM